MLEKIKTLINQEAYQEAFELVELHLEAHAEDLEYMYLKADLYKKLQKTSAAVNLYNHILEIDPEQKRAEVERDLVHMIMLQENKDFFECTNLFDDPWL